MHSWVVSLVRYSKPFLNWAREELKHKYQKKNDDYAQEITLIVYVPRKERSGFVSTEDCVDAKIESHEEYTKKSK